MTWYWWTHWFWITLFSVSTCTVLLSPVETYPVNSPYGNKEYSRDKPLKFPIAAQTDTDDIIIGGEERLTAAVFRDGKYLRSSNSNTNQNDSNDNNNSGERNTNKNKSISDNKTVQNQMDTNSSDPTIPTVSNQVKDSINRVPGSTTSTIVTANLAPAAAEVNGSRLGDLSSIDSVKHNSSSAESTILHLDNSTTHEAIKQIDESLVNPADASRNSPDLTKPNEAEGREAGGNIMVSNENSPGGSALGEIHQNKTTFNESVVEESPVETRVVVAASTAASTKQTHGKVFSLENITKEEEVIRAEIERQLDGERGRKSKVLAEYRQELKVINFSSDSKNLLARSASVSLTDLEEQQQDDSNISSEALSIQRAYMLDAGAISGICFAVLGLCFGVVIAGITLYRRRYLNKPQTLSEPDSSGYIDDSTIRDNSDEMYSLDNDSFLNSLEAMTIQNYWTDTVKHTKL